MQAEVRCQTELGSFWIVSVDDRYFAVPKSLWPVRATDLLQQTNRTIISSSSLTELVDTVSTRKAPLLSIIIPTRGRPAMLRRALDSLKATTHHPDSIEVILVVDSDDQDMSGFSFSGVPVKLVCVPPGMTMGNLNMAGYEVASGDYIFLLNDDVIARTNGWDTLIAETLKSFPDGVVLVSVNDKLFQDTLCTFPLMSRAICEMIGGISRREYIRYRIDDHIHNIFNLLALLGHRRIVYMEEVVFEHLNRLAGVEGTGAYVPNPAIHAKDTLFFNDELAARKTLAVRMAGHIDSFASQNLSSMRANKLLAVTDSVAIRDPRYTRRSQGSTTLSSDNTRVTVGVVSADIRSEHSRKCIEHLKAHTRNFDLILLDNNGGPNFNHAREMNRMLAIANTEFIVLMDDDVFVEPGWLDEMLKAVNPGVGMVTPGHKNLAGDFAYGGIVMRPDQSGHHTHIFSRSMLPRPVQTVCSAVYLLDLTKCGHLRVDEQFSKYFLDIEFGLKVWEAGFQVVCTTSTIVTHVGGGTLKQGSELSGRLYEEQRQKFVRSWIETGRYWKLESTVWNNVPELRPLVDHPGLVGRILDGALHENTSVFNERIDAYCSTFGAYSALLQFAENAAGEVLAEGKAPSELARKNVEHFIDASQKRRAQNPDVSSSLGTNSGSNAPWEAPMEEAPLSSAAARRISGGLLPPSNGAAGKAMPSSNGKNESKEQRVGERTIAQWRDMAEAPVLVKEYLGRAILRKGDMVAALPLLMTDVKILPEYVCSSIEGIERWVAAITPDQALKNYRGFVVSRFEHKYFAIDENEGEFSYEKFRQDGYRRSIVGHSMAEVTQGIDRVLGDDTSSARLPALVFVPSEACDSIGFLDGMLNPSDVFLVGKQDANRLNGRITIVADAPSVAEWAADLVYSAKPVSPNLGPRKFDKVVLPWIYAESMRSNLLEIAAGKIADRIQVIHGSGAMREYDGETLHRITYNKAYLASMMEHVPSVEGLSVLEVGCSDGLVCDLMVLMGAKAVVGIDVMQSAGCNFPNEKIEYRAENAAKTSFADQRFDLSLSIATMEHVPDPLAVLEEMLRVTKVGGICYVQAGPLYHSPFGHHMFSYFADFPWIHVRKSKEEIIEYVKQKGIDRVIEKDLATSAEQYVSGMLNREHINGLFLEQYGLDEFRKRKDIEILKFNVSYEGKDLLTPEILAETGHLKPETLVEHGFEIMFRRKEN